MLAQSNKLVGITRAAEPAGGGGAGVHHRSSSPPISGALSRAGVFHAHTHAHVLCTCAYTYFIRVGALCIPRNSRLFLSRAPHFLISRISLFLSGIAQPSAERARLEMICEVSRELIGLADKRRATLRILTYDRVAIICLAYLLNGGSVRPIIGVQAAWGVADVPRKLPACDSMPTSSESISPWRKSDKAFRRNSQSLTNYRVLSRSNKAINCTCT